MVTELTPIDAEQSQPPLQELLQDARLEFALASTLITDNLNAVAPAPHMVRSYLVPEMWIRRWINPSSPEAQRTHTDATPAIAKQLYKVGIAHLALITGVMSNTQIRADIANRLASVRLHMDPISVRLGMDRPLGDHKIEEYLTLIVNTATASGAVDLKKYLHSGPSSYQKATVSRLIDMIIFQGCPDRQAIPVIDNVHKFLEQQILDSKEAFIAVLWAVKQNPQLMDLFGRVIDKFDREVFSDILARNTPGLPNDPILTACLYDRLLKYYPGPSHQQKAGEKA